jgi:hypothetical protein
MAVSAAHAMPPATMHQNPVHITHMVPVAIPTPNKGHAAAHDACHAAHARKSSLALALAVPITPTGRRATTVLIDSERNSAPAANRKITSHTGADTARTLRWRIVRCTHQ